MQYLKTKDPWNARSSWKRSMGPSELYPATGTRGRMVSAEKGWGSAWNRTLDLTPDLSISLTFQNSIQNPHYQNLKASSLGQTCLIWFVWAGLCPMTPLRFVWCSRFQDLPSNTTRHGKQIQHYPLRGSFNLPWRRGAASKRWQAPRSIFHSVLSSRCPGQSPQV